MSPNNCPDGESQEKQPPAVDGSVDEDENPPSETVSLLTPGNYNQALPPTPTLGTSLSTPWRHHQGSAPTSPNLGSQRAHSIEGSHFLSSGGSDKRLNHRGRSPSPNPKRKVIRWIGVNGKGHVHSSASASLDINPTSHKYEGLPQTPHIIVSPEDESEEPVFYYPDQPDNNTNKREQNNLESGREPQNDESEERNRSSTPTTDQGLGTSEPPKLSGSEETNKERSKTSEGRSQRAPLRSQLSFRQSSDESLSSVNSPVEERGPPPSFYSTSAPPPPPEEPPQPEFPARPVTLHPRTDNNSNSVLSLDPNDPLLRKSRKSSMLGMMRRVSSQRSMESGTVQFERSTSKTSLSLVSRQIDWKDQMNDSLILCVSALYAKLLVVMGMAFPIAEIISDDVPLIFYNSFYLYLYFGSILFLMYAYLFLLRTKSISSNVFISQVQALKMRMPRLEVNWSEIPLPNSLKHILPKKKEQNGKSDKDDKVSVSTSAFKPPKYTITETSNHGSMYLKMGAVLFGIGSMIYSGLEFGQYFELRSDSECANILMAISPVARMIFTFLQMYFIFLNSRVAISKHTTIARFGLMHMIGTNLCIWLNVLVQETKHEIAHLTHNADEHHADLYPGHSVESHEKDLHSSVLGNNHGIHSSHEDDDDHGHGTRSVNSLFNKSEVIHNVVRRSLSSPKDFNGCRRINLMGNVVSSASPFLFPCTIEYSLLCAGVLYVMWKNINWTKVEKNTADGDSDISTFIARKVRHHYSVDCARASRGLFMGIFILVLTIISLILFYVLISNEQFKRFAILEANIIELSIYSLAIISVIVGMKQMRELEFILEGDIELDNILLIIAQAGVYIYTSFTIIGGYFSLKESHTLPLLTAVMTLIQTTLQTLFILDGSRRCCYNADQLDRKPGREMVTFLLVCNLAMWAISTFETSRADVHPTQLQFYGIWAWTIISHVSMPLAIFYRFHVTVCLGEIWKRAYKLKTDFMAL